MQKRATVGCSWEIWCSSRETGRFHEKLGDSRENRESWQVCVSVTDIGFCKETNGQRMKTLLAQQHVTNRNKNSND